MIGQSSTDKTHVMPAGGNSESHPFTIYALIRQRPLRIERRKKVFLPAFLVIVT
jgi:hypothetical protein